MAAPQRTVRNATAAALVLLAAAAAGAQSPCATCAGDGLLPCPACAPRDGAAPEATVRACSVAAQCRFCKGALATPCPDCAAGRSDATAALLERRRAAARDWLASQRQRLADAGVPRNHEPLMCRTAHLELWFAPGKLEGCPERDPHLQMHLYAARLETAYDRCAHLLSLEDPDGGAPFTIAVVHDDRDRARLAASLTGIELQCLGTRNGARGTCVLDNDPHTVPDDDALHRLMVHNLAHLMVARAAGGRVLDDDGWGWLDAGVAHWSAAAATAADSPADQVCDCFCHLDRPVPQRRYFGGHWRMAVRELLEAGQLPALADIVGRGTSDLDLPQHATAFALVDFLTRPLTGPTTGPAAAPPPSPLPGLLRAAKTGQAPQEALRAVLGLDLDAVEQRFRAFVKGSYPRR